ncbi:zinc-binding dehydrogenase [Verrucomicrobiota bacterium]
MRSMVLTDIGAMKLVEAPDPKIERDTDVLLDIKVVGVCGSDVHYYTTGRIGSQVVQHPFRVGHECSATVKEVGSKVTGLKPGDLVAVDPAAACGECAQCKSGRPHTCRNLTFLGTPGQGEGCLCDQIVMPAESCFPVPEGVTPEQAAIIEPLSIGAYSVQMTAPMQGARIAILGCGPIGLSVLMPARVQGAGKIYVTDKIDDRLRVAEQAGACWTGNPDKEDIVASITEQEPLLLDAVLECCGQQDALDQSIELLKPGGKLVIVGIPEVDRVSFSIDRLRRHEICVQNIRRQNGCVQAAIDLVASGEINVDFMVTHHFPLERTKEAFDMVHNYEDGVVKALIEVSS